MLSFVAVDVVVVFAVVGLFSGCCSGGCFDVFTVLVVVVGLMAVVPYVVLVLKMKTLLRSCRTLFFVKPVKHSWYLGKECW